MQARHVLIFRATEAWQGEGLPTHPAFWFIIFYILDAETHLFITLRGSQHESRQGSLDFVI